MLGDEKMPSVREIAQVIDLSAVRADSDEAEIQALVGLARTYHPFAVFSLPCFTGRLLDLLSDTPDILVGGVVGFPSGGHTSRTKISEAEELIRMGCGELDMVINIGWLRSGRKQDVLADIKAVVAASEGIPVKVILECGYLHASRSMRQASCASKEGHRLSKPVRDGVRQRHPLKTSGRSRQSSVIRSASRRQAGSENYRPSCRCRKQEQCVLALGYVVQEESSMSATRIR